MLSDPSPSKPARARCDDKVADEGRFLRSWLEDPLRVGAVSPSGRALARMMARYVDPQAPGPVIELGPGNGLHDARRCWSAASPRSACS